MTGELRRTATIAGGASRAAAPEPWRRRIHHAGLDEVRRPGMAQGLDLLGDLGRQRHLRITSATTVATTGSVGSSVVSGAGCHHLCARS
ncbi:MAG: hypothetical protein U1E17_04150 [Geminicoccaceae bacterium]